MLALLNDAEWGKWSDRKIAEHAGVNHVTVGTVRAELSGENHQMPRRVERNGVTFEMDTGSINAGRASRQTTRDIVDEDTGRLVPVLDPKPRPRPRQLGSRHNVRGDRLSLARDE